MTELSQVIRWNTNFVRGLAEAVLNRARAIRGTLPETPVKKTAAKAVKSKPARKSKRPRAKTKR